MRAGAARGWGSLADFALRAAFLYYLIAILLGIGRVAGTVGRPYGGFVWLHDDVQGMMVGFETGADWPALRAGMRLDDVIVRIDGRAIPLDGNPDVIGQVYAATPVGEPVEYEVARAGAPGLLHFRVPVGLFTPRRAAEAYLPFAAAALSLWAMGFFVYVVSARDRVASLFALWSLSFSAILGYHGFNGFVRRLLRLHPGVVHDVRPGLAPVQRHLRSFLRALSRASRRGGIVGRSRSTPHPGWPPSPTRSPSCPTDRVDRARACSWSRRSAASRRASGRSWRCGGRTGAAARGRCAGR